METTRVPRECADRSASSTSSLGVVWGAVPGNDDGVGLAQRGRIAYSCDLESGGRRHLAAVRCHHLEGVLILLRVAEDLSGRGQVESDDAWQGQSDNGMCHAHIMAGIACGVSFLPLVLTRRHDQTAVMSRRIVVNLFERGAWLSIASSSPASLEQTGIERSTGAR